MLKQVSIWRDQSTQPDYKPILIEVPLGGEVPKYVCTDKHTIFEVVKGVTWKGLPLFIQFFPEPN